jgi:hypothetical protein
VKPAVTLASLGECAQRVGDTCLRSTEFSAAAIVHTLVGVALLGAGAVIVVVQPFTVGASLDRDHALLQVAGQF